METKDELQKSSTSSPNESQETSTKPHEFQIALQDQAKNIVVYLQEIARINGDNFLNFFKGGGTIKGISKADRLFYEGDKETIEDSRMRSIQVEMENYFRNEKFLTYTRQWLNNFELSLNEKNLASTKDFIEAIFKPIESTKEWVSFRQEMNDKFGEKDAEFLLNRIKGSMAFKVIGLIPQEKRGNANPFNDKLRTELFNDYPNWNIVIEQHKNKTLNELNRYKSAIENAVAKLVDLSSENTSDKKKYIDDLTDDLRRLEKDINTTLKKFEFSTLGNKERGEFLLNNMPSIFFAIKTAIDRANIKDPELKRELQARLVENILKIFTDGISKDELDNLQWKGNGQMKILAKFVVEHFGDLKYLKDLQTEHHLSSIMNHYKPIVELFNTKINQNKDEVRQAFFKSAELQSKEGGQKEPEQKVVREVTQSFLKTDEGPDKEQGSRGPSQDPENPGLF
ncbi:hypothetical protein ACNVED_08505 [Legionella sp. D16C41]|uniref:hypothetical protein n=1 Tax=Legionella sp. D16C41 TaxID=3402688 RepID=UPI003AF9024F